VISLVLPYPVSANRYWISFYAPKLKRVIVGPTKEAKQYKRDVGYIARAAGFTTPWTGRVGMSIVLHPHRPLDWAKRAARDPLGWEDTVQCIDLGNCEKVLEDALEGIVYVDDKQIWHVTKDRAEPDDRGARVVVSVWPIVQRSPQLVIGIDESDGRDMTAVAARVGDRIVDVQTRDPVEGP
jgi:crossover junction endodeoxyribonuclease RusA